MKVDVRKNISSINNKALYKVYKNNKRYNANSISSNYRSAFNLSRDNNKLSIWTKWSSKKGTRGSKQDKRSSNKRASTNE